MAEVWLAEDVRLGRPVAIKVLSQALLQAGDASIGSDIEREARVLARLQHPNIVGVYDAGSIEGRSYLAMEYVPGYSLRELLESSGRMSEMEAIRYGQQIAGALQYAHEQGVVHCDVKPENILVNDQRVAKVTDFGVADRVTRTLTPEQAREVLGTIAYLAPEVMQGTPSTPASDVYSLGLTIYELAAGRLPFTGATPALVAAQRLTVPAPPLRSALPGASPALESTLAQALAMDPSQRFATAEEFRQALVRAGRAPETVSRGAAAPPPPVVPGPSPAQVRQVPPRQRHPTARVSRSAPPPPPRNSSNYALLVAAFGVLILAIGVGVLAAALLTNNGGNETQPTATPTVEATPEPTEEPTEEPTSEPTATPTPEPTLTPTPTEGPTEEPTATPTVAEEDTPTPEPTPDEPGATATP